MRLTPGRVERGFRRSFTEWEAWRSGASPSSGPFGSQSTFKGYCPSPSPGAYSCAHGYCLPVALMGLQLGPVVACGAHERVGGWLELELWGCQPQLNPERAAVGTYCLL